MSHTVQYVRCTVSILCCCIMAFTVLLFCITIFSFCCRRFFYSCYLFFCDLTVMYTAIEMFTLSLNNKVRHVQSCIRCVLRIVHDVDIRPYDCARTLCIVSIYIGQAKRFQEYMYTREGNSILLYPHYTIAAYKH